MLSSQKYLMTVTLSWTWSDIVHSSYKRITFYYDCLPSVLNAREMIL